MRLIQVLAGIGELRQIALQGEDVFEAERFVLLVQTFVGLAEEFEDSLDEERCREPVLFQKLVDLFLAADFGDHQVGGGVVAGDDHLGDHVAEGGVESGIVITKDAGTTAKIGGLYGDAFVQILGDHPKPANEGHLKTGQRDS